MGDTKRVGRRTSQSQPPRNEASLCYELRLIPFAKNRRGNRSIFWHVTMAGWTSRARGGCSAPSRARTGGSPCGVRRLSEPFAWLIGSHFSLKKNLAAASRQSRGRLGSVAHACVGHCWVRCAGVAQSLGSTATRSYSHELREHRVDPVQWQLPLEPRRQRLRWAVAGNIRLRRLV